MLLRSIFLKTIRDSRLSLFWWSLGYISLASIEILLYPSVRELTDFNQLLQGNSAIKAFTGNITSFTTPVGYLNGRLFFLIGPILAIIFCVVAGSGAIAGEEGKKTLPLLVSQSRSRMRILAEKAAALIFMLIVLLSVLFVACWACITVVNMDISIWRVFFTIVAMGLLGLFFGSLALWIGAMKGNRSLAAGITSAVVVGTYLLNALAPLVKDLNQYQALSPFDWYTGNDPLTNGLKLGDIGLLIGGSLIFLVLALVSFRRRDIAT